PTIFEPITDTPEITDANIIANMLESIRMGGQRRITDILNYIIPFYVSKGRKIKHVMVTMALLNNVAKLQKPDNYYILVLYLGSESYESLKNALVPLISDLYLLQEKNFQQIGGTQWPVKLYFSSDWKFLATCLGIKAANAKHFCPWCNCSKKNINRTDKKITKLIETIKINYSQINGHLKEPLFYMILIFDETIWQSKILNEKKRLNIAYQFWYENNKLLYTSFISLMQDKKTTGRRFNKKAQNWIMSFLAPSQGQPNKSNFGHYILHSCSSESYTGYFQNTLKDGSHENSQKSAILEILEHENRQLYFTINDTPNFFKKSKKYRLEPK
ncbi:34838_t:CDS:2, partial [Gigaspora margarita]